MLYRSSAAAVVGVLAVFGSLVNATCTPRARSFIYVVPDGYGPTSQTLARYYESIISGKSSPGRPNSAMIGVDNMVGSVHETPTT